MYKSRKSIYVQTNVLNNRNGLDWEVVEGERRWKKEGEGGIRRGIEWLKRGNFCRVFWEREFFQKKGGNKVLEEKGRKLEEGVNSREGNYTHQTRKLLLGLSTRGLGG